MSIILGEHGQQEAYPPPNVSEPTSWRHWSSLDGYMSATPWCTPEPGTLFMCGRSLYRCLPANWTGTCSWGSLPPQVDTVPIPSHSLIGRHAVREGRPSPPTIAWTWPNSTPGHRDRGKGLVLLLQAAVRKSCRRYGAAANSVMSRETPLQQGNYRTRGAQTASLLKRGHSASS